MHTAAVVLLAAIGVHRLVLTLAYLARRTSPVPDAAVRDAVPRVTVQLPLYNERFVARRLIRAAAALDWPADRLEIQVLDDSTDDTTSIVSEMVGEVAARGICIHHVRRAGRAGYKAGALAHGMATATGELFLVLDADFEPGADLLRQVAGAFEQPDVGFVQVRWDHANRAASFLTRTAALLLDGHFFVEHHARFTGGHLFNFNGTAGVLRRTAIAEAGGWQSDTLTEDLDLSYRMQIAGWRGVYLKDCTCPGDLPATMADFKSQQRRWVEGSIQCARKLLPRLLSSDLPRLARLEAALHLLTNFAYPLMLAVFLTLAAGPVPAAAGSAGVLGVLAFYGVAHREGVPAAPPAQRLAAVAAALALGSGLAVSNTLAVLRGLVRTGGDFERTPKVGEVSRRPPGYFASVGATPALELALGAALVSAAAHGVARGQPASAALLALSAAGMLWVGLASALSARS